MVAAASLEMPHLWRAPPTVSMRLGRVSADQGEDPLPD